MHYYEDVAELIEGLNEEMIIRLEQIGKIDKTVQKLQAECQDLERIVFENEDRSSPIFQQNEASNRQRKEQLALILAEKMSNIRSLTDKKLVLAERCDRLMKSVYAKVTESSYHCKIELEVDNPGCTEAIERRFCESVANSVQPSHFNGLLTAMEDFGSSPMCSRPSTPSSASSLGAIRSNSRKRGSISSSASNSTRGIQTNDTNGQKKNKKEKGMSAYMRKKQERLREQKKMQEIHRQREEMEKHKQQNGNGKKHVKPKKTSSEAASKAQAKVKVEPLDEEQTSSAIPTPNASAVGDEDDVMWGQSVPGDLDDDDFDPEEAMDLFPTMLPSPPREIMESLKENNMFGFDDDFGGIDVNSLMPLACTPLKDFDDPNSYNVKQEDYYYDSRGHEKEKRRKAQLFSSVSDTSMHGRPRKLTVRAEKLAQQSKEKGDNKTERWCTCRGESSGDMIMCEADGCPIQWFHFECVGLTFAPKGSWICDACRLHGCVPVAQ